MIQTEHYFIEQIPETGTIHVSQLMAIMPNITRPYVLYCSKVAMQAMIKAYEKAENLAICNCDQSLED